MRKYVIGCLGKVFCFCYESRAFQKAQEENQQLVESINETGQNATFLVEAVKSPAMRDKSLSKGCGIDAACNQIQQVNRTSTSSSDDDEFEKQLEPAYCKVSKIDRRGLYRREDQGQRASDYNNNNETDHFLSR